MQIGEVSNRVGIAPRKIRFYERCELISPLRCENGYREFSDVDVQKLRFLARARSLGFSLAQCRELLGLWEDRSRQSADVKALAKQRLQEIEQKIDELRRLKDTLAHLVEHCHGDHRPDCPILDGLAQDG